MTDPRLWASLLIALVIGFAPSPPAYAVIRTVIEAPGQTVYQARHTLTDQEAHTWQVITFQRVKANAPTGVKLRLVGFPGVIQIDHGQPLAITNALNQMLRAPDISDDLFPAESPSVPHIGQYSLQEVLSRLHPEIPARLVVPLVDGNSAQINLPPEVLEEWQMVATIGLPAGRG